MPPSLAWLGAAIASAPPTTALSHDVEVHIDGLLRLTERLIWTVRTDGPGGGCERRARAARGVVAIPRGGGPPTVPTVTTDAVCVTDAQRTLIGGTR